MNLTGPIVTTRIECAPSPAWCGVVSCAWNLAPAMTIDGHGSRCGRAMVGASLEDQAAVLGITPDMRDKAEKRALAKLQVRLRGLL